MIVAVRLDGRGRCSFDCICVCVNTLLLVARPAWHVTFRRHCCRLDRKARKSRSHRRAGQDQSTRTSGRSQDETKVGSLWQDHEFRITVPSSRYQRRQAESNTRHAPHQRQAECAMPIPSATCRIVLGMTGEFAHAALSLSPCRSTRDVQDGMTQMARRTKEAERVHRIA